MQSRHSDGGKIYAAIQEEDRTEADALLLRDWILTHRLTQFTLRDVLKDRKKWKLPNRQQDRQRAADALGTFFKAVATSVPATHASAIAA